MKDGCPAQEGGAPPDKQGGTTRDPAISLILDEIKAAFPDPSPGRTAGASTVTVVAMFLAGLTIIAGERIRRKAQTAPTRRPPMQLAQVPPQPTQPPVQLAQAPVQPGQPSMQPAQPTPLTPVQEALGRIKNTLENPDPRTGLAQTRFGLDEITRIIPSEVKTPAKKKEM